MDEQKNNSLTKNVLPVALIAIGLVAAVVVYSNQKSPTVEVANSVPASAAPTIAAVSIDVPTIAVSSDTLITYQDGAYQATGNYVSPGGPREIKVGITLENGIVTDTTFEGTAEDPPTKRFQAEFADNYKALVVGKNISELNLSKVSGSSLTPIGFNDALQKIKQQAVS